MHTTDVCPHSMKPRSDLLYRYTPVICETRRDITYLRVFGIFAVNGLKIEHNSAIKLEFDANFRADAKFNSAFALKFS